MGRPVSAPEFCEQCGVRLDMHDMALADPCEDAEAQAEAIERIERTFFGFLLR